MPLFVVLSTNSGISQSTQIEFGKNRVQYKDFSWSFYESDHFFVYFYLGGQDLGKFVTEAAEKHIGDIENILEYKVDHKIEILVYNNLTDLKQTNIGANLEEHNTGGQTKIIGNKVFVYFDGNHDFLVKQIREGIARIFINDMMYGGNVQEVLQNAVLLNLPSWFVDGIISFIGEKWSPSLDNRLRDGIMTGKFRKFNKLSGDDAQFAGHAIWYYISINYGDGSVPNLLYLTRINRSLESGFLFVIGKTFNQTIDDWYRYFYRKYKNELKNRDTIEDSLHIGKRSRKTREYSHLKISNDGKHIAYATNYMGKYHVYYHNLEDGTTNKIFSGGYKTQSQPIERHYPMFAWNPAGNKLAIIYESRDKTQLLIYEVESGKKETDEITKYQKVVDLEYMGPNSLAISAINRGQSDLFIYHIKSNLSEQLTNDFYDDLQPRYIKTKTKEGLLFVSNRSHIELKKEKLDSLVPTDNFDIYFIDTKNRKNKKLIRVTNTKDYDESMPMQYDKKHIAFLSDENGINNRFIGYFDTTFSHYDTIVEFQDSTVTNPDRIRKAIKMKACNCLLLKINQIGTISEALEAAKIAK
ncbi:MAG: hypothetical protein IH946_04855, partial [Bacteroidetes bacterium]|nr:hypothetical protein [Bacteroidota bacterium]